LSYDPTAGPTGINKNDVWVLTGVFVVATRNNNRENFARINIELTNLGTRRTIARTSEAKYFFHPAPERMQFISKADNDKLRERFDRKS